MLSIACPSCSKPLKVDPAQAGSMGKCPRCAEKFRIEEPKSKKAKPPAPERPRKPQEDDEDEGPDLELKKSAIKESPPKKKEEPAGESKKKQKDKKKKKKSKTAAGGPNFALIGMIGAIVVGAIVTSLILFSGPSAPPPPKMTEAEAVAKLQARNVHLERDESKPEKPVIFANFTGGHATAEDYHTLAALPHLTGVSLSGTAVNNFDLELLVPLKLKKLDLARTKISDGGAEALAKLTTLEELIMDGTLMTDCGINELKTLKNLKRLSLAGDAMASGRELNLPNCQIVRD